MKGFLGVKVTEVGVVVCHLGLSVWPGLQCDWERRKEAWFLVRSRLSGSKGPPLCFFFGGGGIKTQLHTLHPAGHFLVFGGDCKFQEKQKRKPRKEKGRKVLNAVFPPGFEPGTFRVLGECDNRYTTETPRESK